MLTCLALLTLAPAARAGAADTSPVAPAVTPGPATTDALWRLAAGRAEVAPYDPATFIGPPVPLAILYAPAAAPLGAGLRIDVEVPLMPVTGSVRAPAPEPLVRLSDVAARLVPVRRADGTLIIDLAGITMVDLRARRDAQGLRLFEGDEPRPVAGGDR